MLLALNSVPPMLWKVCDHLHSMTQSCFHDLVFSLPHSMKKTLHHGSRLTHTCKYIHHFLSKESAPLSCPQLRSRFAFSYVFQQDTYLGRKQCDFWWIFFPICGLLCWVYKAVTSFREDNRRSADREGRRVQFLMTQKGTRHCWVLC